MGSPLSPFLANLFMSHFETELKKLGNFPRVWYRYVDDVWAIIKKQSLRNFLNRLNKTKYSTIKFTCEEEQDGKLNFLDLVVINNNNNFVFDIYRKPTNTGRYITSNSLHPWQHKLSAFHSMIHRALNIPMNEEFFANEIQRIKTIAHLNGYTDRLIDELITAHRRKRALREHTSLSLMRDDNECEITHWSSFTRKMRPILGAKKHKNQ